MLSSSAMEPKTPLQRAKDEAGGAAGLARRLAAAEGIRITPQAISQWVRTPAEKVLLVERVTGVSRHELRPDLYPSQEVQHGGA